MKVIESNHLGIDISSKHAKVIVMVMLAVLLYGVQGVSVYNVELVPFGVSMVLALYYVHFNGYVLGGLYAGSFLLANEISVVAVLNVSIVCGVMCLIEYLRTEKRKIINKIWIFCIGGVVCSVVSAFGVRELADVLPVFVTVVLGLLLLYSALIFFDATINKGLLSQINLDEKVCGSVILIIFGIGVSKAWIGGFAFGLMLAVVFVLIINRLVGSGGVMVAAGLLGVGFAIAYFEPLYISLFVILSMIAIAFKCKWRILSGIGVVIGYVGFVFLFNMGYVVGEIFGVAVGVLVYMCVPAKLLATFSDVFVKVKPLSYKKIFQNTQEEISARVKKLSEIFAEMKMVYRQMVKGNLSDAKAKELIKEETIEAVCVGCQNRDRCFRSSASFMDNCFDIIIDQAYQRGRILLIDIPEYVTTNCGRVNQIILNLNHIVYAYNEYKESVINVDASRMLIADQLSGVSKLLKALSNEVGAEYSFDNKLSYEIKEALGYEGVVCSDVVVCEKSVFNKNINIIANNNKDIDKNTVKVVNKLTKQVYKIINKEACGVGGSISITLGAMPRYDIAFGVSRVAKNNAHISGDNSAVVDIGDGKYLVGITDGMGSGRGANEVSSLTIKLIESFYKAGFDNDIILSSVNKLLALGESERFSTIDICAIDARSGTYDFIKYGATEGYLKRVDGEVELISSSGLPIGVLEDVKPHITKKVVSPMDMIVFVSDGVSDVLGNLSKKLIENSDISNPQVLADKIIQEAVYVSNGIPADDMTAVCVKVFENLL